MTSVLFFHVAAAAFVGQYLSGFAVLYSGDCDMKQSVCNKYNSHELDFRMIAAAFVGVMYIGKRRTNRSYSDGKNWASV